MARIKTIDQFRVGYFVFVVEDGKIKKSPVLERFNPHIANPLHVNDPIVTIIVDEIHIQISESSLSEIYPIFTGKLGAMWYILKDNLIEGLRKIPSF